MQVWKSSRNIGVWAVAVSLAAGSALCGVGTALAEDTATTKKKASETVATHT